LAAELIAATVLQSRTKAVSSTPTTVYGHGFGGLFSAPGLEKPLFSAMVLPAQGLASMLPVRSSNSTHPLYGIFTGVTDSTGTEPIGVCDDPPVAGLSKLCTHSFVFGRQGRMSRVFDIDRMGVITHRGEFSDLQIIGNPFAGVGGVPSAPGVGGAEAVAQNELAKAFFEMATAWSRDFSREVYTGNPVNNTAGGGRKFFYGLDILVNTGYRDAETGIACPAADSIITSFGSAEVNTNGTTAVLTISNILRNLKYIASRSGLDPVTWNLAMPWGLFYELTNVWPQAYYLHAIASAGYASNVQVHETAQTLVAQRDEMRGDIFNRTGQFLYIDGQKVPVILDDAITETVGAGATFTSTIYFVPMTVLGGTPVTFLEYLDYDMPNGAMAAARALAPDGQYSTSDNGRFLWHKKPPTNFCVQYLAKTEPRMLLLTPYLAARLTNVRYTPIAHQRDWDVASSYFVDGGRTSGSGVGPSYFSPTA